MKLVDRRKGVKDDGNHRLSSTFWTIPYTAHCTPRKVTSRTCVIRTGIIICERFASLAYIYDSPHAALGQRLMHAGDDKQTGKR